MGPAPTGGQDRGAAGEPEVGELYGRKEDFPRARGGRDWQFADEGREGGRFWKSLIPSCFQSGAPRPSGETEPSVIWIEAVKLIKPTPSRTMHLEVETKPGHFPNQVFLVIV